MKFKTLKKIRGPSATFEIIETEIKKEKIRANLLHFPQTVGILAYLNKDKVLLVKQYRFPFKKEIWEIPAGKLEKNEDPKKGAKRELLEETGYLAQKLEKIISFYPTPGYSSEILHLFRATKLKKGKQKLEKGEIIKKIKVFRLKTLFELIKKGKISDAKTIIAVFWEFLSDLTKQFSEIR